MCCSARREILLREDVFQSGNLLLVETSWEIDNELDSQYPELRRKVVHGHALLLEGAHVAIVRDSSGLHDHLVAVEVGDGGTEARERIFQGDVHAMV